MLHCHLPPSTLPFCKQKWQWSGGRARYNLHWDEKEGQDYQVKESIEGPAEKETIKELAVKAKADIYILTMLEVWRSTVEPMQTRAEPGERKPEAESGGPKTKAESEGWRTRVTLQAWRIEVELESWGTEAELLVLRMEESETRSPMSRRGGGRRRIQRPKSLWCNQGDGWPRQGL